RKTRIILSVSVVSFLLYAVLTGGLAVSSIKDFDGQKNICLVPGLTSDVWLAPKISDVGLLFVFHYYATRGPFSLRLQIWDERREYQAIEISEVLVEYKDGDLSRKAD